jgi:2-polyprenyl-3-methyl-5-hydroxy-6-metoxy-1,4-benzoquinol methylase
MRDDSISECFDNCACARAKRARPASLRGVSRLLGDMLDRRGLRGRTVLEVGCGLGGLTLTTASHGATRSMGVDLSPVAIREASRLAEEAGLAKEASFAVGDGAEIELPKSDVVVLDKVICCYPRVDALIQNSLRATGSMYAFVVPFSSGIRGVVARMAIGGENALRWLRRQRFRAYVHDVRLIEQALGEAGLARTASARRFIWYVAVHERPPSLVSAEFGQ